MKMLARKWIVVVVAIIVLITSTSGTADVLHDARAIDVSGGENHTLVPTQSQSVWGCGPNGDPIYYDYYGVLGTGSSDADLIELTLVRVWAGDMSTASGYLEDINDIDSGWKHSLALDVNGFVWVILVDFVDESGIICKAAMVVWSVLS